MLHISGGAGLPHFRRAAHQRVDIHAGGGNGQQAHGRQHTVASADVVGHHKGLVAVGVRQGFQRALMGVGGGVDAAGRPLFAIALLQYFPEKAERYGRLGGGAGLGDDVDGEVHILHQFHDLRQRLAAEAVADKVDVGGILLFQIIIGGAQALDHAPGAQIGAADADDYQCLRVALDPAGRRFDAVILLPVIVPGQMHPAGELTAETVALLQMAVGNAQAGRQRRLIGQPQKALNIGKINLNHRIRLLNSCV